MALTRRQFLTLMGGSAGAAVLFQACGLPEEELLIDAPIEMPEDLVRGEDAWYATSMGDFANGDGVLIRVMEGRAKKIEGNPDHPVNRGKSTARYDSVLQLLYHPDRLQEPMLRYSKNGNLVNTTWDEADNRFRNALTTGDGAMTIVTNPIRGHLGSVVEKFAKMFPNQFYNAGVAEQNMMGIASGMALEGNHVFVYSIGNFPTFRCAEQIRNDVDYHNLPVTIVNVGAGVSYGNLGYTHHSLQDYGLMRLFPNMVIASPGDDMEVRACMKYIVKNPQPSYLRLAKTKNKILH